MVVSVTRFPLPPSAKRYAESEHSANRPMPQFFAQTFQKTTHRSCLPQTMHDEANRPRKNGSEKTQISQKSKPVL